MELKKFKNISQSYLVRRNLSSSTSSFFQTRQKLFFLESRAASFYLSGKHQSLFFSPDWLQLKSWFITLEIETKGIEEKSRNFQVDILAGPRKRALKSNLE